MTFTQSTTGPLLMAVIGTLLFSVMDALMKGLSIALGAYNAMFWRVVIGTVICGVIYALRRGQWPNRPALRLHAMRGAMAAGMTVCFFWGLVRIPLAQGIALSFIAPLIALYLAAWLLGERITRAAIGGTLLGFAGVVVMVLSRMHSDYGADVLAGAGAILCSAVLYAYNLVLQRQQTAHSGPLEVAFFQNVVMTLLFGLAAPWLAVVPSPAHWIDLTLSALLASVSLFILSWAYGRAQAQVLLPIEYTAFLWAALLGWLIFNEPVAHATLLGAVMIVGGCWVSARRDHPDHVVPVEEEA